MTERPSAAGSARQHAADGWDGVTVTARMVERAQELDRRAKDLKWAAWYWPWGEA